MMGDMTVPQWWTMSSSTWVQLLNYLYPNAASEKQTNMRSIYVFVLVIAIGINIYFSPLYWKYEQAEAAIAGYSAGPSLNRLCKFHWTLVYNNIKNPQMLIITITEYIIFKLHFEKKLYIFGCRLFAKLFFHYFISFSPLLGKRVLLFARFN